MNKELLITTIPCILLGIVLFASFSVSFFPKRKNDHIVAEKKCKSHIVSCVAVGQYVAAPVYSNECD